MLIFTAQLSQKHSQIIYSILRCQQSGKNLTYAQTFKKELLYRGQNIVFISNHTVKLCYLRLRHPSQKYSLALDTNQKYLHAGAQTWRPDFSLMHPTVLQGCWVALYAIFSLYNSTTLRTIIPNYSHWQVFLQMVYCAVNG